MVNEADARQLACTRLASVISDHGATVDIEAVQGGWHAVVTLPPGAGPLLGLGDVFVADDGTVVEYPSSFSPSMAREAFSGRRWG